MILNYDSFNENRLLESLNESILYFSPPLSKLLNKISDKNEIAKDIISLGGKYLETDYTFLDFGKEGYLSFSTMRNALTSLKSADVLDSVLSGDNSIENKYRNDINGKIYDANLIYKKERNELRIGKIINKLFPKKYSDKQIEEFVNLVKGTLEKQTEKFLIVEGDEIAFWYKEENYKESKGSLGQSCMRGNSEKIFKIYTENPEVCRMVILVEDDKLLGRSLLWKLNSISGDSNVDEIKYLMDRQYTINDSDVNKFREFANKNGFAYKSSNSMGSYKPITFNGGNFHVEMTVKVKNKNYDRYPYVDTFKRFDPSTGIMYNDEDDDEDDDRDNAGQFLLNDTGGNYEVISEGGLYSEYFGVDIPEDEAVYSDYLDSWIYSNDSVEVEVGYRRHRGYYPSDYDQIVRIEGDGSRYAHIDDTVYSEYDDSYILDDECIKSIIGFTIKNNIPYHIDTDYLHNESSNITEIDKNSNWYERCSEIHDVWNDLNSASSEIDTILRSLTVEVNRKFIPKIYVNEVYKCVNEKFYLTKRDAEILGFKVITNGFRMIDVFTYEQECLIPLDIKNILKSKIDEYEYILSGKQLSIEVGDEEDYLNKIRHLIQIYKNRYSEIENYYGNFGND